LTFLYLHAKPALEVKDWRLHLTPQFGSRPCRDIAQGTRVRYTLQFLTPEPGLNILNI